MKALSLLLAALTVAVFLPVHGRAQEEGGQTPAQAADEPYDTLAYPGEVFILTKAELLQYNIHTLEDILELASGVVYWRAGPPGSYTGYSIDGRGHRGVTLFINGIPCYNPFPMEPLTRFLPFSRLERIEIIYSGSPLLVGDLSTNGAINFVIEEGGRAGPESEVDFTYGQNNRRARRFWIATPKAHISGSLAYDQYLQDAMALWSGDPGRVIGDYDTRSVLLDLSLATEAGDELLFRIQEYEDTYVGSAYSAGEDVRFSGYHSEIKYQRGGFSALLGQREVSVSRAAGRTSSLVLTGRARWDGGIGAMRLAAFASVERTVNRNTLWDASFDPTYHRIEGGAYLAGTAAYGFSWRTGLYGGDHSTGGGYLGGEAVVTRGDHRGFSQRLVFARRVRVPSCQELYQPELERTIGGEQFSTRGNIDLDAELTDELSLGASLPGVFSLDLFARNERQRIVLTGSDPAVYSSSGEGEVTGLRGWGQHGSSWRGFGYGITGGLELFGRRSPYTYGIPEFRLYGSAYIQRRVFKETELVSLRWDARFEGEREWRDVTLDGYDVHTISISITLMSAVIRGEVRNLLDEEYATVPGFLMPGRYYTIGVIWNFFD